MPQTSGFERFDGAGGGVAADTETARGGLCDCLRRGSDPELAWRAGSVTADPDRRGCRPSGARSDARYATQSGRGEQRRRELELFDEERVGLAIERGSDKHAIDVDGADRDAAREGRRGVFGPRHGEQPRAGSFAARRGRSSPSGREKSAGVSRPPLGAPKARTRARESSGSENANAPTAPTRDRTAARRSAPRSRAKATARLHESRERRLRAVTKRNGQRWYGAWYADARSLRRFVARQRATWALGVLAGLSHAPVECPIARPGSADQQRHRPEQDARIRAGCGKVASQDGVDRRATFGQLVASRSLTSGVVGPC